MRRVRFIFGALLAVLWMAPLRAQEPTGTVRGRVTDDATQQPLVGAAVTVGSRRAQSDAEGRYVITGLAAGTDSIRVRMLGYVPVTRAVTVQAGQTVLVDVPMTAQAVQLSAIVAVGYGEQRQGDITGAVVQLTPADFNTGKIISPEQLVASKVAGVQVVDNNAPGGGLALRVRGTTSIQSSEPLYVIDGMPVSGGTSSVTGRDVLNFLNPNDIQSITVLKDASAASIYGTNAAAGVVIITTKSGQGAPKVEYDGSMTSSSITKTDEMLNASQFTAAVAQYAPANSQYVLNANTDWMSLIERTGVGQEHNVVVSGSGLTSNYRLAAGYQNQQGVIKGSSSERISLGFNYDQRLFSDRLDIKANLRGSRTVDQILPGAVIGDALQMAPTSPVYDSTSTYGYWNFPSNVLQSNDNPLETLNTTESRATTFRSVGNIQGDLSMPFLPALHWNLNLGYDVTRLTNSYFAPNDIHQELRSGEKGNFSRNDQSISNTILETYLDYSAPLGVVPGTVDATAGYSYGYSYEEHPSLNMTGLSTNLLGIYGVAPQKDLKPRIWSILSLSNFPLLACSRPSPASSRGEYG